MICNKRCSAIGIVCEQELGDQVITSIDLQSLVKCLDHRRAVKDGSCLFQKRSAICHPLKGL